MELPVSEAIVDLVLLATNGLLLAASEEYAWRFTKGEQVERALRCLGLKANST